EVRLDRDLMASELHGALERGEGVPLAVGGERLHHLAVAHGSPIVGRELRELGLAPMGVVVVALIRGEGHVVPDGGTRFQVGDGLLVAADNEAIARFRALLAPASESPALAGGEAPDVSTA